MSFLKNADWKFILGLFLLIVSPIWIFKMPIKTKHIEIDLAAALWWIFILWLLWVGKRDTRSKPD